MYKIKKNDNSEIKRDALLYAESVSTREMDGIEWDLFEKALNEKGFFITRQMDVDHSEASDEPVPHRQPLDGGGE